MIGIITVIIHDYAILMKYYHEYPKHSREVIEQDQLLIISLQCVAKKQRGWGLTHLWQERDTRAHCVHLIFTYSGFDSTLWSRKKQLYKF